MMMMTKGLLHHFCYCTLSNDDSEDANDCDNAMLVVIR
jgi:hypothetical protein